MFNTVTRDAAESLAEEAGDALDTTEALDFIINCGCDGMGASLEFLLRFYCFII